MKLWQQLLQARAQPVPKGWLTLRQLADAEDLAPSTFRGAFKDTVRSCVELGLLERKPFRIATPTGLRLVNHYRRVKSRRN
jgi:AraC-like DNA-binding protein